MEVLAARGAACSKSTQSSTALLTRGPTPGPLCCIMLSVQVRDGGLFGNNGMCDRLPGSSLPAVSDSPCSLIMLRLSPPDSLWSSCSLLLRGAFFPSSQYTQAKVHSGADSASSCVPQGEEIKASSPSCLGVHRQDLCPLPGFYTARNMKMAHVWEEERCRVLLAGLMQFLIPEASVGAVEDGAGLGASTRR